MAKFLDSEKINELAVWLVWKGLGDLSIHRDFSDGVRVAHLIMHCRPGLVDLHSYPACSSFRNKIVNWNWLNKKALNKLGLGQKKAVLEALARGDVEWTSKLLYGIMAIERGSDISGLACGQPELKYNLADEYRQRIQELVKRVLDLTVECKKLQALLEKREYRRTGIRWMKTTQF